MCGTFTYLQKVHLHQVCAGTANYPKLMHFEGNPWAPWIDREKLSVILAYSNARLLNGIQWNSYLWPTVSYIVGLLDLGQPIDSGKHVRVPVLIGLVQSVPSESTLSKLLFGSLFLWNFFYFLLQKGPKSHRQRLPYRSDHLEHHSHWLLLKQPTLATRATDWFTNVANSASHETALNLLITIASNTSPQLSTSEHLVFLCFLHLKHNESRPITKAKKWEA